MPIETTSLWKVAFPWMMNGIVPDPILRTDSRTAPNLINKTCWELWFERHLVDPERDITSRVLADMMMFEWANEIPTRNFAVQLEQFGRQILNSKLKIEDVIRTAEPPGPDWNHGNTPYQLPGYEFFGKLKVGGTEAEWSMFLIPMKASVITP